MNIYNKRILFLPQYSAPYTGNFIGSLMALEKTLQRHNCGVGYVFPIAAKDQPWYSDFSSGHICYLTRNDVQNCTNELITIFNDFSPDLVHTHFDGYDIPVCKAAKKCARYSGNSIHIVWHLHDMIEYQPNPIKKLYQMGCFTYHYGYFGAMANVISVSSQLLKFVEKFRRPFFGKPFPHYAVIRNGIDFSRLYNAYNPLISRPNWGGGHLHTRKSFTFIAFGGRNIQKRIDILIKAALSLNSLSNKQCSVILTEGVDTVEVVNQIFDNHIPDWVQIIPQSNNIASIFDMADCFVSSSVHETFSYAICEASVYGLPVIQSDISGTEWNLHNPSTFAFKSLDVEDLQRAMLTVMNHDSTDLQNKCLETRKHNFANYDIQHWCDQVINFYKTI